MKKQQLFVGREFPLEIGAFDDDLNWHVVDTLPSDATLTDAIRAARKLAAAPDSEFCFWSVVELDD